MRALHELQVTGRRALDVWLWRGDSEPEPPPDRGEFRRELEALLDRAPAGLIDAHAFVEVPADRPPWLPTPLELTKGDRVTWVAAGRVELSRLLDLWVGADFQLWARPGEAGRIFRGTRDTHTFTAEEDGRLHLASYFPGEWSDDRGALATPPDVYRGVRGGITVLVLRWGVEPEAGLRALSELGPAGALFRRELERLAHPLPVPDGWSYLWFLGPAEIFGRERDGERDVITCRHRGQTGILQRDVSLPLTADTRLRWSWRVDRLPSALPEDVMPTHDYMSIAVEFENGRDLTYYWSSSLPLETGYACPIPTWRERETHVVVRSGPDGLGRWHDEERDVRADYARFVGEPPERIVRVWLIANSVFQRREGACRYADIGLVDGGAVHEVR